MAGLPLIDITGQRFGRLVVVGREDKPRRKGQSRKWICECDCGNTKSFDSGNLRAERQPIVSCGCFRKEICAAKSQVASAASAAKAKMRRDELGIDGLNANMVRQTRLRENHEAAGRPREYPQKPVVFERDGGLCHICHIPVDPTLWHLDHILSILHGGLDTYDNVAVSHPDCNQRKWANLVFAA